MAQMWINTIVLSACDLEKITVTSGEKHETQRTPFYILFISDTKKMIKNCCFFSPQKVIKRYRIYQMFHGSSKDVFVSGCLTASAYVRSATTVTGGKLMTSVFFLMVPYSKTIRFDGVCIDLNI